MKKIFHTLLLTLLTTAACSQSYIDSLEKELALSKPDTNRVSILSALSLAYVQSDISTSIKYGGQGLALARDLKFKPGEADCLRRMGIAYFAQGPYPEALDLFQQALSISESINHSFGISAGLGHMGNIYAEQGNHARARSYYFRQLQISRQTNMKREEFTALRNISDSYLQDNMIDSAEKSLNELFQIPGELNDRRSPAFRNLGTLSIKKGSKEQAVLYFHQAIDLAKRSNSQNSLTDTYLELARLYQETGQGDSCIFYGHAALEAGRKNSYAKGVLAASQLLADLYDTIDAQKAVNYYKMAATIKDSLFNTGKSAQVQNLLFLEQQRQHALEVARTNYRNQIRLYLLLAGLCLFLVVAIILYRNNRSKQKANKLLYEQKQEIQLQKANAINAYEELKSTQAQLIQSEKMASLGELTAGIAHEIQNPLNFVNNFSEVNNELIAELKSEITIPMSIGTKFEDRVALLDDIYQNNEKIKFHGKRADAIVKGMLLHSRVSTGQKEPTDINALADEYLRLSYHGMRARDKSFNAELQTDFDPSIEKISIISQDIGRVLLNLYNNAFYAVNEKRKLISENFEPTGSVRTEYQNARPDDAVGRGSIKISIKDNGNGIPEKLIDKIFQPFFTTKPTGQGTGLGLSLAYDIITKGHRGELGVKTGEGKGSEFIIQLPVA